MRSSIHTWGEALPELLSLLRVVEGEGVEVAGAPDLELGLGLSTRDPRSDLLYPRLCRTDTKGPEEHRSAILERKVPRHMGRTGRILAGRDLDELLDVADFLGLEYRHGLALRGARRRSAGNACHGGIRGGGLDELGPLPAAIDGSSKSVASRGG